jgi:hypothetical protein
VEEPVPELPRCWPKKLPAAMKAGWFGAGDEGPAEAEVLEDEAAGGGLVDMAPSQGVQDEWDEAERRPRNADSRSVEQRWNKQMQE